MVTQCLDDDAAHELATGQLVGDAAIAAHAHLDTCEQCRRWVSELARLEVPSLTEDPGLTEDASLTADPGRTEAPSLASPVPSLTASPRPTEVIVLAGLLPGHRLGPYQVQRRVGSGGMSFVYSALDPRLNRLVALKVLRPDMTSATMQARMLREAQAMARLSHPNVLPVYEVREFDGTLCIAMELVDGSTLSQWLAEAPRAWRDVLHMFLQAGRGLGAAHAAGIVHRDFKPGNVLVGTDGRARVTDFGLARLADSHASGDMNLTRVGMFIGTPVYMSPEHTSGTVEPRSDQFSFCVALYEGLFGRRPFSGASIEELSVAFQTGRIEAPEGGRGVPSWLRRVVLKGLSSRAEERYPSMDALCDALERGEREHLRRRTSLRAGAAAMLVALGAVGWWAGSSGEPPPVAAAPVVAPPPAPPAAPAPLPVAPSPAEEPAAPAPTPATTVAAPAPPSPSPVPATPAAAPAPVAPAPARATPAAAPAPVAPIDRPKSPVRPVPVKRHLAVDRASPYGPSPRH
jgi:hypothetical protein